MNDLMINYLKLIKEGKYRKEPITDAPEIYHKTVFYSLISTLLGKSVYLNFGHKKIYSNLWFVLVGKSSLYRKSTAIKIGMNILKKIEPDKVLPTEFSLESLVELLEKKPVGIFWIDEFSNFFSQFHRSYLYGGLSFFLQLYDGDISIERYLKSGTWQIEEPCINILSATTLEGITSCLKERELRTGLLTRFNYVVARKKEFNIEFPDVIDYSKLEEFIKEIQERTVSIRESIGITQEAREYYSNLCKKYTTKDINLISFYSRTYITILKLLIIEAVIRREEKITKEHIVDIEDFIDILFKSIDDIYNSLAWTAFQEKEHKVIEYLSEKKMNSESTQDEWVSRTELIRATRLSSSELNAVIKTLIDKDLIEVEARKVIEDKKRITFYRYKEGK